MTPTVPARPPSARPEYGPMLLAQRPAGRNALVKLFIIVPLLALVAAVPPSASRTTS